MYLPIVYTSGSAIKSYTCTAVEIERGHLICMHLLQRTPLGSHKCTQRRGLTNVLIIRIHFYPPRPSFCMGLSTISLFSEQGSFWLCEICCVLIVGFKKRRTHTIRVIFRTDRLLPPDLYYSLYLLGTFVHKTEYLNFCGILHAVYHQSGIFSVCLFSETT